MSLQEHMQIFTLYLVRNTLAGYFTRKEIASLRFLKRFQQLNPHLDQSGARAQQEALPGSPPFMFHLMLQSSQGWVKYLLCSFFFFPSKEIKNKKIWKKKQKFKSQKSNFNYCM